MAHRLAFGCELGQEGAQARGQGWGMAVFSAKVQVKAHPLVVVRALVCRHLSLIQIMGAKLSKPMFRQPSWIAAWNGITACRPFVLRRERPAEHTSELQS